MDANLTAAITEEKEKYSSHSQSGEMDKLAQKVEY
jgi:hypothetical protein